MKALELIGANKKTAIFILVAAIVIYLDLAFVLKAQLAAMGKISPQIAKLKNNLAALDRDLERMRLAQKKTAEEAPDSASRAKKFICESDIDTLLEDISNTAAKNNINILSIQKSSPKDDAARSKSAQSVKFRPFLISLNLSCGYDDLVRFIGELENSASFIGVANLTVATGKKDLRLQEVNLVLKTYVTKPD